MINKTRLALAALMLAGTSVSALADEDEVGRAILRELRMLRKEIQQLRHDLSQGRQAGPANRPPQSNRMEYYRRLSEGDGHKRQSTPSSRQPKGSPERVILITETEGPDGKRIRKVIQTEGSRLQTIPSHRGKGQTMRILIGPKGEQIPLWMHGKPDSTKRVERVYEWSPKSAPEKSSRRSAQKSKKATRKASPGQDQMIELLRELLRELQQQRLGKRRHVEYF